MTTFPITSPTCGYCGVFLWPLEREGSLRMFSFALVTEWPLPLRLCCATCIEDEAPAPGDRPPAPRSPPALASGHRPGTPGPHPRGAESPARDAAGALTPVALMRDSRVSKGALYRYLARSHVYA